MNAIETEHACQVGCLHCSSTDLRIHRATSDNDLGVILACRACGRHTSIGVIQDGDSVVLAFAAVAPAAGGVS